MPLQMRWPVNLLIFLSLKMQANCSRMQFQPASADCPAKASRRGELRKAVLSGAQQRYGTLSETVQRRIEHEMNVIEEMGLADYFLIVADIVSFAKRQGIPVGPGRGSAASSAVAYCLGSRC